MNSLDGWLGIVILIQLGVKSVCSLIVVVLLYLRSCRQYAVIVPARLDLEVVLGLVILRPILALLQVVVSLKPESPFCLAKDLILSPVCSLPPRVVRVQHYRVGERAVSPIVFVLVRGRLVQ